MKKLVSLLLTLVMVLGLVPFGVMAEGQYQSSEISKNTVHSCDADCDHTAEPPHFFAMRATYYANGKAFPNSTFPADGSNNYCSCGITIGYSGHWCCWPYATAAYSYIWGKSFNRYDTGDNYISEIAAENRRTTGANLKKFFAAATPGAMLRLDNDPVATNGDNNGHSMIFLGNNSGGTGGYFLEANYDGTGRSRIYEWNWDSLASIHANSANQHYYIKYIMWPGAPKYSDTKPGKPTVVVRDGIDTWLGWAPVTNGTSYDVRFYAANSETAIETIFGITNPYFSYHLEPGTYRANVAAVNNQTGEYTFSDYTANFTVTDKYDFVPSNIVIWNNHMYSLYNYEMGSWLEAETFCETHGGHLATITSEEENNVIYQLVNNTGKTACFLGANKVDGTWKWVTGESFSYAPWNPGQPDNYNSNEKYLEIYTDTAKWNDNSMVTTTTNCFVMEVELDGLASSASTNHFVSNFERYDVALPWAEAEAYCEYLGGHLAVIPSAEVNSKIETLVSDNVGETYFIGATDKQTEGTWKWVTDETVTFNDWAAGEPVNTHEVEDYAVVDGTNWYAKSSGMANNAGFILELEADHEHLLHYIVPIQPNCTEDGHIGYYYCAGCGKCYSDAEGVNEIGVENTIIPATGHTFVDTEVPATCINYAGVQHTCTVCGYSYITYVGEYSEWSTEYPEGIDEALIESRIEYRYRDYVTTTSDSDELEGWTLYDSTSEWGEYGAWSGWSTNYVASNEYTQVETRTAYQYYYFVCSNCGAHMHSTGNCYSWGGGCGASGTVSSGSYHVVITTVPYSSAIDFGGTGTYYIDNSGEGRAFAYTNSSSQHYVAPFTQYRSRTRSLVWTYYFYSWTDWSEWSPEPVEATDTREVETRTVYRYVTGVYGPHQWNDGEVTIPCTHEHDGEMTYTCELCGATYTEPIPRPTEYTITYYVDGEYYTQQYYWAGETIEVPDYPAPEGYTFLGWTLENGEPVPAVMPANDLNVYGTTIPNLVTITYTGDYSAVVEIPFGSDAELPVLDVDGLHYVFTVNGQPWDGVNVTEDVTVTVSTEIDVYTVTFMDPVTGEAISVQQIEWLEPATAPEAPYHYGYTFEGWDGEFDCIEADTVIYAIYTPVTFTVIFTDGMDNIISEQEVPYLSAAAEPEIPVREGWVFAGWDADFSCVTASMVVNATWEPRYITITFSGSYTGTEVIAYGSDCPLPEYNSSSICYVFKVNGEEWCPDNVTEDADVTVSVAAIKNTTHIVEFFGINGEVIDEQLVKHGEAAVAPEAPAVQGYTFVGWDRSFDCVTHRMKINAIYEEGGPVNEPLPGDVDGDGMVTFTDISVLYGYLLGKNDIAPEYMPNADFDGDGVASFIDVGAMYYHCLGGN